MKLLLTKPFTDELTPYDEQSAWAVTHERLLREIAWRDLHQADVVEVSLIEAVPATDAQHICHVCGGVVTWTDHLPPVRFGEPVRCFANVRSIESAPSQLLLEPGVRQVGGAVVYSAEFLSKDPESV